MARVVLTGGPGSGKTLVARRLVADAPARFALVPEAATRVYERLGTRWDRLDVVRRRDVQRQIYRLQLEQEQQAAAPAAPGVLLLDRGTVDGAAYWPDGPDAYWAALGTTRELELARYDAVIWLQSCAALGLYDGPASNPCRVEPADVAMEIGQRLRALWSSHARVRFVDACATPEGKIAAVRAILDAEFATGAGLP